MPSLQDFNEWEGMPVDFCSLKYKNFYNQIKEDSWRQKNGEFIKIGTMGDEHLYNAFKMSGDERLFVEMTIRLFRNRLYYQKEKP